jgi:ankyrin repeat protein
MVVAGSASFVRNNMYWNKRLVQHKSDYPLIADEDKIKCFLKACANGLLDCTKSMLESDYTLARATDRNGFSGLHFASSNGHLEIVQCIIQCDDEVKDMNLNGSTALMYAAGNGDLPVVEYLCSKVHLIGSFVKLIGFPQGADITLKHNDRTAQALAEENDEMLVVKYFKVNLFIVKLFPL